MNSTNNRKRRRQVTYEAKDKKKKPKKMTAEHRQVLQQYTEAKEYRKGFEDTWRRNLKYYLGDHWAVGGSAQIDRPNLNNSPKDWRPVINICFKNIETTLPILADIEPTLYVDTSTPNDNPKARELSKKFQLLIQQEWRDKNVRNSLWTGLKAGLIYGTSAFFTQVTPEIEKIDIGFEVIPLDPFEFFIDPFAKQFEDSEFFIRRVALSDQQIKDFYGINRAVKADEESETLKDNQSDVEKYYVDEFWTPEKVYTIMGEQVVKEEDNDRSVIPFSLYVDYDVPGRLYGMGEIDVIIDVQRELNKRAYQIIRNADLMGAGQWKVTDAGIEITNEPGEKIVVPWGEEAEKVMPMQLPSAYYTQMQMIIKFGEMISGVNELTAGNIGSKDMSGDAIALLKHSNYNRIRQKSRNLELTLSSISKHVAQIIQDYYRTERKVQTPDGETVAVNGAEMAEEEFKIEIVPGTVQMRNKQGDEQKALALYQMGAFGDPESYEAKEELLTALHYPGKDRVLARMNKGGNNGQRETENRSRAQENS